MYRLTTYTEYQWETVALLHDGKDVLDQDYKNFAAQMWSEGHSFFMYLSDNPDSLASCCRLRNKIQENTFSFTNGLTGVQTGSCNVITLNLNRIVQNWVKSIGGKVPTVGNQYDSLKSYLTEIVFACTSPLNWDVMRYSPLCKLMFILTIPLLSEILLYKTP